MAYIPERHPHPEGLEYEEMAIAKARAAARAVGSVSSNITRNPLYTDGEVRIVDEKTGGEKGAKLARFDMIPSDVLWELAEHFGRGEAKYPSDKTGRANWQRGYRWSLSIAALQRHLHQWLMGEEIDQETGSRHLVAVIWHATALLFFQKRGLGTDDRHAKP